MKMFRFGCLLLSIPLGAASSLPLYPEEVFPELMPALNGALGANPSLRSSELRAALAEARAEEAAAAKRPRASAFARTAGAYITRDDIDDEFRASIDANISVNQPIYHWGALDASIAAGRSAADAAIAQSKVDQQRQLAHVRDLFLRWQKASAQDELLLQSLASAERTLDAQRKLFEAGQRSEADVLNAELRGLELTEARASIGIELASVAREFSAATGTKLKPSDGPLSMFSIPSMHEVATWVQSLEEGIYQTPSLIASTAREAEAEARIDVADAALKPKVDLVAGIFGDQLDAVDNTNSAFRVRYFAGLQMRWDFFDGGRNSAQRVRERAQHRSREAETLALSGRLEATLIRSAAQLELFHSQIASREARADLLVRQLELWDNPAQRDQIAPARILDTQRDLAEVQRQALDARFEFLRTLNRLNATFLADPVLLP